MHESPDTNRTEPTASRLYTVADFRRRVAVHARTLLFELAGFIGAMTAYYAVVLAIRILVPPPPEGAPQTLYGLLLDILLFLGQFLPIAVFGFRADRATQKARLTCARCKGLLCISDFNFAIAIHCCPHCHKPLFQEWNDCSDIMVQPDDMGAAQGEFTFADVGATEKKRNRAKAIWIAIAAGAAAAIFGMTVVALWLRSDILRIWFGPHASEMIIFISLIPALSVLGIVFIWAFWRTSSAYLRCCGCGARIDESTLTRTTGNCTNCGLRVIRDAPLLLGEDDPPESKQRELAASEARVRRYAIPLTCTFFSILAVSFFIWARLVSWWFGIPIQDKVTNMIATATACFGVLVLTMTALWLFSRVMPRSYCPYCQNPLNSRSGLVRATGNCSECGRRVLKGTKRIGPLGTA